MSVIQHEHAGPESSHFEIRAFTVGLEVSRVLSMRRPNAPGQAIDVVLDLIAQSGVSRAAAIWTEAKGEAPDDKGFGHIDDPSEYTVGVHEDYDVAVCVGLVVEDEPASDSRPESLELLAELLAQQLGRFLTLGRMRQANESARKQLCLDREALQLRKTMERARALLVRYGSMTAVEATEYLVSVSVRTGRPLLGVAERIVRAYGGPQVGFRWPTSTGERRGATRHAVA